jgi:hypothetical protein
MKISISKICATMSLILLPQAALSQSASTGGRHGLSSALGLMAMTNSTKQGGQGTSGSTILTQFDASWHWGYFATGIYTQYDKQGNSQTDFALGPRLELTFEPFYLELCYAAMLERNFIDRAIETQTGSGYQIGIGTRFSLGESSSPWFLQSSYRYRVQNVKKQDGVKLEEPITQTDGYPLFGIGFGF